VRAWLFELAALTPCTKAETVLLEARLVKLLLEEGKTVAPFFV
jgi:hypothetical protein